MSMLVRFTWMYLIITLEHHQPVPKELGESVRAIAINNWNEQEK